MKKIFWIVWLFLTLCLLLFWGYKVIVSKDKSQLLIGEGSHGHYQIEMSCESCHTSSFSSKEDLQLACVNCHGDELKLVDDTHPRSKFTDPRNADRTAVLDARFCVTCHTEHQKEYTLDMGLTIPGDFCFHCHQDIAEERPSHKNLEYDTCASAGCHNFHDNTALYEDFLLKHANEPAQKPGALLFDLVAAKVELMASNKKASLTAKNQNMPNGVDALYDKALVERATHEWDGSAHANAGVNCLDCHSEGGEEGERDTQIKWVAKPDHLICANCHVNQAEGFYAGKHGMRVSPYLEVQQTPLKPKMSTLAFKDSSLQLEHGCNACHGAHAYDINEAAVDGCLVCHDDEHSRNYKSSTHYSLWQQELKGELESGQGVSCASCHMPRKKIIENGKTLVQVEHNQNAYYQPNEKMVRPVCMHCHGLGFVLDSLADKVLIEKNFHGSPGLHVPSIDWALFRENIQGETNENN